MRRARLPFCIVLAVAACSPTGVGDPCTPEVEPEGGFSMEDIVLEVHSVQCRTRACMTYRKESFCTRRCEADDECNADWYEDGPGRDGAPSARCEAPITVGDPGVVGRYCVPGWASDLASP